MEGAAMKWFLIIVILAVIALVLSQYLDEPPRPVKPPQTAAAPTPEPTTTPQAPPPRPAAQANPNANVLARMQTVARQTGVRITSFQPQQGGAVVAIAWPGGNAALGGDFLENCMKEGIIRDIDLNKKKEGMAMENGQQIFTAMYTVLF